MPIPPEWYKAESMLPESMTAGRAADLVPKWTTEWLSEDLEPPACTLA